MTFNTPSFWYKPPAEMSVLSRALIPLGWVYGAITAARMNLIQPQKAGAPVICVGNLTAGGSGKTPVAVALMKALQNSGWYKSPCFLTRGYGGTLTGPQEISPETGPDAGDEALLLSRTAPTVISRDRLAGAHHAAAQGHDLIIMDDGLQNPYLRKDISFIVVNGPLGWGNRRLIPAGPLREFIKCGLKRAHALIALDGAPDIPGDKPVFQARRRVSCPLPSGSKVIGFCALGRPEGFRDSLQTLGYDIVLFKTFPDHHRYSASDIQELKTEAARLNARLVTTEKDAVKIFPLNDISTVTIDLTFENPEALLSMIKART
ncbi:MAG: tetraacyldisaccharide 4'-kinase [Micavibrio aeruginosavorus]|uniref:Tetraacyldisaccharide 4'-kinase n=1 Tax=Micavibrio aeruginosavorus TaxID=349221 RepID=A0A7T5R082_9BACT|nr:MAG: tetraacyldisaccharide 4'-kinase [Micavibrio aeruginosavorus]